MNRMVFEGASMIFWNIEWDEDIRSLRFCIIDIDKMIYEIRLNSTEAKILTQWLSNRVGIGAIHESVS